MNPFIKSISLILSTTLLIACGSSSSDSNKPKPYSLDDYQGRTVSSDSLAGTWVSVGTGEINYSSDFGDAYEEYSSKEYFVIRSVRASLYQKASCFSHFYDIEIEGDSEFSFEGIKGSFTNNNSFSGERKTDVQLDDTPDGSYSESSNEQFIMVKISDDVESIGWVATTIDGDRFILDDAYCFIQISRRMNIINSEIDGIYSEISYTVGVDGEYNISMSEWEPKTVDAVVNMFVQGQDFTSQDSSDTDFTINYESSFSHGITFSASGMGRDIGGDIEIELPSY